MNEHVASATTIIETCVAAKLNGERQELWRTTRHQGPVLTSAGRAALERHIDELDTIDRLMRQPPVPIVHRTARGALRPGRERKVDYAGCGLTTKGIARRHRRDTNTLYQEHLCQRKVTEAESWEALVDSDAYFPWTWIAPQTEPLHIRR